MNPEIDKLYGGKYGMVQPTQAALDGVSSGRLFNGAYPNNQTSQNSNLFYANSTPNPSITAQSLSPQTAFTPTLPQYPPLPGMPEAIINEQFAPLQGDQQISGIQSKIAQLTGQFAQEDSRRSQLLANPDIEAQRKSVNELSNQLSMIQKQASAIPLQLEQESVGKGITSRVLNTQQESSLRRNTIQALQTSSLLQAAQGNLTLALDQVDRAVKAEFEPLKAELTAQRANLEMFMNDPNRTREEKRRAAIAEQQLKDRERQINTQEENKKAVGDAKIALIKNNPQMSSEAMTALQQARTPEDVAIISSAFGLTNLTQQQQFDQQIQQKKLAFDQQMQEQKFLQDEKQFGMEYALQQRKFDEDKRQFGITNSLKEAELNQKATENNLDPSQLIAYAQQYASTGQIPPGIPKGSFGAIAEYAKEAPKAEGTLISKTTGVADSKIPAAEQQDFTRLAAILKNVERLKALDEKRIGGIHGGTLGKVFGSNAQAEYLATRKSIVDDISRMQSGAALTADEVAFYGDYLPGRFSESFGLGQDSAKKIENFETIMRNRLTDRLNTNNLAIVGFSKVKLDDGNEYTVGQIVTNEQGQKGRVNPDGSITYL